MKPPENEPNIFPWISALPFSGGLLQWATVHNRLFRVKKGFPVEPYPIIAILITLAATFFYINHLYLRLPMSVGRMLILS